VEIIDWEELTTDYRYNKIVQILAYAMMIKDEMDFDQAYAGIISFKNLNSGYLSFGVKTSPRSKREQLIDHAVLKTYSQEIKKLILEICNPDIPFVEKEIQ
jgi:hypothetical protein